MFKVFLAAIMVAMVFWHASVEKSNAEEFGFFSQAQEQEDKYFNAMTTVIPSLEKSIECMALNIYHEARNESKAGRMAVAWVVINRVNSELFPDSVCGVVYQGRISKWHKENTGKIVPLRNQCQFSWYCDGKSDKVYNPEKFEDARDMAYNIMSNYKNMHDITGGALWYHADYVNPRWAKDYERTAKIDTHIFYKEK